MMSMEGSAVPESMVKAFIDAFSMYYNSNKNKNILQEHSSVFTL
jgi:hypothetical protein